MLLRGEETERLRGLLARPGPSITLLVGPPGSGRSTVLRHSIEREPGRLFFACSPIGDRLQGEFFGRAVDTWSGATDRADDVEPGWDRAFSRLVDEMGGARRRLVLGLDDARHLWSAPGSGFLEALHTAWTGMRSSGLPGHLVLAGEAADFESFGPSDGRFGGGSVERVVLAPLGFRSVARLAPGYSPLDQLRAYAVFGSSPARLSHLRGEASLGRNVIQSLAQHGPLLTQGAEILTRSFQRPTRYSTIVDAMAHGAADWGSILARCPELDSGGQIAPYLVRLEEREIIRSSRSLDAAPTARRRRYRLVDPYVAFWHRLVLPHRSALLMGRAGSVWSQHIRPALGRLVADILPVVARAFLRRHAREVVPAVAREVGGLWGSDYHIEVAATLTNGAVAYGNTAWPDGALDVDADDRLAEDRRRTAYGFGREARLRFHFSATGFTRALRRRAARDHLLYLIGPDTLMGQGPH